MEADHEACVKDFPCGTCLFGTAFPRMKTRRVVDTTCPDIFRPLCVTFAETLRSRTASRTIQRGSGLASVAATAEGRAPSVARRVHRGGGGGADATVWRSGAHRRRCARRTTTLGVATTSVARASRPDPRPPDAPAARPPFAAVRACRPRVLFGGFPPPTAPDGAVGGA